MFGPKPKLDDVRDEGGRMSSDPVFGFKRDLVRLLANLCYQHKDNQEEVRFNWCFFQISLGNRYSTFTLFYLLSVTFHIM